MNRGHICSSKTIATCLTTKYENEQVPGWLKQTIILRHGRQTATLRTLSRVLKGQAYALASINCMCSALILLKSNSQFEFLSTQEMMDVMNGSFSSSCSRTCHVKSGKTAEDGICVGCRVGRLYNPMELYRKRNVWCFCHWKCSSFPCLLARLAK